MSTLRNINSFPDVEHILSNALSSEKGLAIEFDTPADAHRFISRANSLRVLQRKKNLELPEGDPMHGCSHYDLLYIRHIHKGTRVVIEVLRPMENLRIEKL